MKILLVNIDSKEPNLTLMQLASWHRAQGHEVGWDTENPDVIYISCILDTNRAKAYSAKKMLELLWPDALIDLGGSGVDIHKRIPEVELLTPDYSIYPMIDYSLGFTSRGCIRKCPFCIVPEKEGKFRPVQHPQEFHDPRFKKIVFLDNNILASKEWFFEVTDWVLANGLKVDFNQGLDVRLFDKDIVNRLKELKWIDAVRIAFDNTAYRPAVEAGLDMMQAAGFAMHNIQVYVYVDSDADYDDAVARCRIIKGKGARAYAMLNLNAPRTTRLKKLKWWTGRGHAFYAFDIDEMDRAIQTEVRRKKKVSVSKENGRLYDD